MAEPGFESGQLTIITSELHWPSCESYMKTELYEIINKDEDLKNVENILYE